MKTIKILIISFCIIIIMSQTLYAMQEILDTGKSWMETGEKEATIGIDTANLKTASSDLYNILLTIATIVIVTIGAILGIQYMTAGLEEKVKVKESLLPYLISSVVVFGSFGIWKLVVTLLSQLK